MAVKGGARGRLGEAPKLRTLKGGKPEPEPKGQTADVPKPEKWLSKEAAAIWKRVAPIAHEAGNFPKGSEDGFAILCEQLWIYQQAVREVRLRGILISGRNQSVLDPDEEGDERFGRVKNPALQIARDSATVIRGYLREFGLTPLAQSGFQLPEATRGELDRILTPEGSAGRDVFRDRPKAHKR